LYNGADIVILFHSFKLIFNQFSCNWPETLKGFLAPGLKIPALDLNEGAFELRITSDLK
jgi:hypothetical protein